MRYIRLGIMCGSCYRNRKLKRVPWIIGDHYMMKLIRKPIHSCPCLLGFRSYGNQTWPMKWNAVSSRRRSCRYCCMDALLGRRQNGWRRSSTAIIQECCEQYWTGPGSNTPHGANCTATYHLSRKLYKLDEPDMPDTAGEAKTRS